VATTLAFPGKEDLERLESSGSWLRSIETGIDLDMRG
jgi:hypothetical protein